MHIRRVTRASVIAFGIGASALTMDANVANAAPPPCSPQAGDCRGGPAALRAVPQGPPQQHDQGGGDPCDGN